MNQLSDETSPYLLQHADNPVDWFPWGDEAFAKARQENKPILLSIGYSTCHWCHVMAHESFENEAIASQMNESFVSIKVDREERPDIDSVYMSFTQALTGQGGWPMTVFLTHDLKPFFAGTYFPPEDGHGRPGFGRLLASIDEAWKHRSGDLVNYAADLTEKLRSTSNISSGRSTGISDTALTTVVQNMKNTFDDQWGGFGSAPKFPNPSNLEFLLMYGSTGRELADDAKHMALFTLEKIVSGGIRDQLGGGFARYSVDRTWTVPHFEKMLYDNAALIRVLTHASQCAANPTQKQLFESSITEAIDWLSGEMKFQADSDQIAFFSAQDADSEGIEGKYFVWTSEELSDLLTEEELRIALATFGVNSDGNFRDPHNPDLEGLCVLTRASSLEEISMATSADTQELPEKIEDIKKVLLAHRNVRVPPEIDRKILTSWNGLLIGALAEAGRVLRNSTYIELAEHIAKFIRSHLWSDTEHNETPKLKHVYANEQAKISGMLEDYSYLGLGLIDLYKATGNESYLSWASELLEVILDNFEDGTSGGYYDTAKDDEPLIIRPKSTYDAAIPAPNGAAALLAIVLSGYFRQKQWKDKALRAIDLIAPLIERASSGLGITMQALLQEHSADREIVLVGTEDSRRPFEEVVAEYYLPTVTIALGDPSDLKSDPQVDLLVGRETVSEPDLVMAYICENMVCKLPTSSLTDMRLQLEALTGR